MHTDEALRITLEELDAQAQRESHANTMPTLVTLMAMKGQCRSELEVEGEVAFEVRRAITSEAIYGRAR